MYSICFIILLYFFFAFPNNTKDGYGKLYLPFSFIVLFFFSAFRFNGWHSDFGNNYINVIKSYSTPLDLIIQEKEFLHILLMKFVAVHFHDPLYYFIITSFLILFFHYLFVRRFFINEKIFVMFFFCTYGYSSINNITRQSLALSFILLGVMFLLDSKYKKSLLCFLPAYFIHTSALFFLLLLPLIKVDFTKKMLLIYALLSVFAVPLVVIFLPYIQMYFYSEYVDGFYGLTKANPFNICKIIPVVVSMFLLIKKESDQNLSLYFNNNRMLKNLTLHSSMLYMLFMIITCAYALIFVRLAFYFTPFALLAIDRGLLLFKERNVRFIYYTGLFLFIFLWFYAMQYEKENSVDSQFIWQIENRPIALFILPNSSHEIWQKSDEFSTPIFFKDFSSFKEPFMKQNNKGII